MAINQESPWIGKAGDLTPADLLSIARLVFDGRAVRGTVEQISARLENAHQLALFRDEGSGRIVAVAALKRPDPGYRRDTFDHAVVPIAGHEEAPELGYVVVAEDKRGRHLSSKLMDLILNDVDGPVFSTTDDETMKKNLRRAGFKQVGQAWKGNRGVLSLWVVAASERKPAQTL